MITRFNISITKVEGGRFEVKNAQAYQLLEQGGFLVISGEDLELITTNDKGKQLMRAHSRDAYWVRSADIKDMTIVHLNYPETPEDRKQLNTMAKQNEVVAQNVGGAANIIGIGTQVVTIQ